MINFCQKHIWFILPCIFQHIYKLYVKISYSINHTVLSKLHVSFDQIFLLQIFPKNTNQEYELTHSYPFDKNSSNLIKNTSDSNCDAFPKISSKTWKKIQSRTIWFDPDCPHVKCNLNHIVISRILNIFFTKAILFFLCFFLNIFGKLHSGIIRYGPFIVS